MRQVIPNLYIATVSEVLADKPFIYVVNVANTLHYKIHKWQRGEPHQDDKCYLVHEEPKLLSVNWVDGPAAYFDYKGRGIEVVVKLVDFLIHNSPAVVVCDQGLSRSPSVVLLYLAATGRIDNSSFEKARSEFTKLYPLYQPKEGIVQFIDSIWYTLFQ